ncbi:MAG: hypothetical protein JF590_07615 [Gemmatimonadetes bacterium]|nr:hypothetical protein [Gemmatimonadota bacterium]
MLTTTDPKVDLGPGVHTGMDENAVRVALRLEQPMTSTTVEIPICSRDAPAPDEFAKLTLRFDHRVSPGLLVGMELSQYGP